MGCGLRSTRSRHGSSITTAAAILWCTAPGAGLAAEAADPRTMQERYARAEGLLPWNIERELYGLTLEPRWEPGGSRFEYADERRDGAHFYAVDPANARRTRVSGLSGEIEAQEPGVLRSPGGRWAVRVRNGNLFATSVADGRERQLTTDAAPDHGYALPPHSDLQSLSRLRSGNEPTPYGVWSPDGARLLTYRVDERGLTRLPLVVNTAPGKPHHIPYAHHSNTALPGSERVPLAQLMVFDLDRGTRVDLRIPPLMLAYAAEPPGGVYWNRSGKNIYAVHESRDFRTLTLYQADATSGVARAILNETSKRTLRNPMSEGEGSPRLFTLVGDGEQIVLHSERDDWGHYYLYERRTGRLLNRVTHGNWVAHGVHRVDERGRWLYFTACGREPGRDPYYPHLYRVRLDGTQLKLLTPEDAAHAVEFSPDGKFFIDTYSTVDQPPRTVLRAADGRWVMDLMTADVSALERYGWRAPQRIKVTAGDGVTDLYGTLFLPPQSLGDGPFPLVDASYQGPQIALAPVTFLEDSDFTLASSMAQLGFAVLSLDARGTALRSQSFQDFAYGEGFGRPEILSDHVTAIRQLTAQHSRIDAGRVGYYGYSWGGYRAARALLQFPDFFKVAVASAGSHDNVLYIYEHDRWFGASTEPPRTWELQSNLSLASKLKGKLLLVHGDVDDNVHPANTLQLSQALIQAGKEFDQLIFPGRGHDDLQTDPYYVHRKWDYFVRHLAGLEPPQRNRP
jgi:dipeptidyl-peptidase 4